MSFNVVKQVLAFMSGLEGTGAAPTVLTIQTSGVHPTIAMAPWMDDTLDINAFSHLILGLVMTGTLIWVVGNLF